MIKTDVLADLFFKELSFPDRILKIAECGYNAIETWQGGDADLLKEIGQICSENGIRFVSILMNGVNDNTLAPSRKENMNDFVERIDRYSDNALHAGCSSGIVTAGNIDEKLSHDEHCKYLTESLRKAGELAAKKDFNLNLEMLNTIVDHKGYFLDSRESALDIVKNLNMPNVKMLYDIYHMGIMEGNQTVFITQNIKWIGHFHCAGIPGRHELFDSEINYCFISRKAEELGYNGYFGLEYIPTTRSSESLKKTLEYLYDQRQSRR